MTKRQEFTSTLNKFKAEVAKPARPMRTFEPLRTWPARPHDRQVELDDYRGMPSRTLVTSKM